MRISIQVLIHEFRVFPWLIFVFNRFTKDVYLLLRNAEDENRSHSDENRRGHTQLIGNDEWLKFLKANGAIPALIFESKLFT